VLKQALKMIPKYEALEIIDLWVKESRFNERLAIIPPETKTRFTQTEKIVGKTIGTITDEAKMIAQSMQTDEFGEG
jgi:hypothetical protein